MGNYELVQRAIIERKQVIAKYQGHRREMCPHVIGHKRGRPQALFLQFGGTSSSGLSPLPSENWRCIPVEELVDVELRDGEWHTAPNHSRPQTCVDEIAAEVTH